MRTLVFPVGPEWFGLPLDRVREVIALQPVTYLPGAPPWLTGLTNLRGELVPVIELSALLRLPNAPGTVTHLAIVETDVGTAGVITTGPPEPADLGESLGEGEAPAALARYPLDDRVVTLLDLGALVHTAAV